MSSEAVPEPLTHAVDAPSAAAEVVGTVEESPRTAGLRDKLRGLLHELSKFGTVGAVAFAVDVSLVNVLWATGMEVHLAAIISMTVAATLAFVGNRFWTWRDRPRSGLRREYSLYFTFNVVGLLIALGCLSLSHDVLGSMWPEFRTTTADNIAKNLVGTALGTLFRFWSYRTIVFRAHS